MTKAPTKDEEEFAENPSRPRLIWNQSMPEDDPRFYHLSLEELTIALAMVLAVVLIGVTFAILAIR